MRKDTITKNHKHSSENLTQRQIDILLLIYRYRFLNRVQIQQLLNHKYHSKIITWLGFLSEKTYLKGYYSKKFASIPSLFSLGSKGRKFFRENAKEYTIKTRLLDRIWHESNNSWQFKNRCMLLATIYLSLCTLTQKTGATMRFYTDVDLFGMNYLPRIIPDAFFSITEKTGSSKRFFLVVFTQTRLKRS